MDQEEFTQTVQGPHSVGSFGMAGLQFDPQGFRGTSDIGMVSSLIPRASGAPDITPLPDRNWLLTHITDSQVQYPLRLPCPILSS